MFLLTWLSPRPAPAPAPSRHRRGGCSGEEGCWGRDTARREDAPAATRRDSSSRVPALAPQPPLHTRSAGRVHRRSPGKGGINHGTLRTGGARRGTGARPTGGSDGFPGMRKGSPHGIGVPVMEMLGWTRCRGCGGRGAAAWDGGHEPVAPPDPSAKLSHRPPPPSRLSHGLRGAGLGFFWDQIVPAWAGQTRPPGCNTTQKPAMNFLRGGYCWRCTSQNGMSKPTPISHGSLPEGGKLGPIVLQPQIPRALGR